MDIDFNSLELTPFEADAEAIAEMNEWYDVYSNVDRYMAPADLTLHRVIEQVAN
jgi:hypothetical protein